MSKVYDEFKQYLLNKFPCLKELSETEAALADANFALDGIKSYHKRTGALPPVEFYPWLGYFVVSDAASSLDEMQLMEFTILLASVKPAFAMRIMEWEKREFSKWGQYSMDHMFGTAVNSVVQLIKHHILKPHTPQSVYWMFHASYILNRCPREMVNSIRVELIQPFQNTTGIAVNLSPDPRWEMVVSAHEAVKSENKD
jgi:hypothetical protein